MSRTERGFNRDWRWSVFHRCMPPPAYMIDVDTLECCRYCKEPIYLAEVARDIGQSFKPTTIILNLAKKADIKAFLIFYKTEIIDEHVVQVINESELLPKGSETIKTMPKLSENQLQMLWNNLNTDDRLICRIRQIYPQISANNFTAREFYDYIHELHSVHELICPLKPVKRELVYAKRS